jgi:HK97 family phage prohead protease
MGQIERRTFRAELRKDGTGRKIRGTAVVFNQLSENLGGYREQIAPEAFDGCDMSDVRCLFNHDDSMVLGRTVSKTLTLSRDAGGVQFECEPPDTSYARDLAACMDRGDIDQCSFSFVVAPSGATWDEDPASGGSIRTVTKISRLYDVSVVTYPAYPQTSSELRSQADILSERTVSQPAPPSNSGATARLDLLRRELDVAYHGRG